MKKVQKVQKVHKVHKAKRTNSGFTLVETLVAVTILMIAIAGPLTVAEKGLSASIYARDQLMASYLAQDGMEYIKNIVDTNEINIGSNSSLDVNDYWITGDGQILSAYCKYDPIHNSGYICTVDTVNDAIVQYPISSQPKVLYLGSNGYTQQIVSGQASSFTRYFYVQPFTVNSNSSGGNGGSNNAANITVMVTWPGDVVGGGGVTLQDTLYDAPLQ